MYYRLGIPHTYSIYIRILEDGKYRRLPGLPTSEDSFDFVPPVPQRGDLVTYWIHRDGDAEATSWMGRVDDVEYYYGGYDDDDPVQEADTAVMVLITLYLTPLTEEEFDRYQT